MNIKRIKNITTWALVYVLINSTLCGPMIANANEVEAKEVEVTSKELDLKVTHTGIVTSTTLNVRTSANASAKRIGEFKKGDKVEIVAKSSNGWYKVKFKDTYGYLNGS